MRTPVLLLVLAAMCCSCRSYDDARILQTLNQRGFGRKYVGDSNEVLTVGINDSVQVSCPTDAELNGAYKVRMDGVIDVALIGEVFVAGFAPAEIAETLKQRYSDYYTDLELFVFPSEIRSKRFFMRGEVTPGEKLFEGDTTVWDAVAKFQLPLTADLDDIYVIRSDPKHPLIIPVDLRKMLEHGDSSDNVLVREDDIIVVNPNFAGIVRNFVQILLAPIQPVTQLFSSLRSTKTNYESLVEDTGGGSGQFGLNNGFNQYGTGGVGGVPGGFNEPQGN